MDNISEETRNVCPRCKSGSIGPGEHECAACSKKQLSMPHQVKEMGMGGLSGFQAPLGAKVRRNAISECMKKSGDLKEGHVLVFFKSADAVKKAQFFEALDFMQYDIAADMIREQVVRETVRSKIQEVVRKKAGGGGYVLYAPNKGKKHGAKDVGTFPTKLAAKRAELARFPPKDPKKLQRLRKQIEKLMKDPKKRAEAERQAMMKHGNDTPHKPHRAGKARGHKVYETKILAKIIVKELKSRISGPRSLNEGLFKEEVQASQWDDFIKNVSSKVLDSDRGFQRIQKKLESATEQAMAKAVSIIQKQLGGDAKVKASKKPGKTEEGESYVPFTISLEAASVGPIYLHVEHGRPTISISKEAKNSMTSISPGAARAIRGAIEMSSDALAEMDMISSVIAERDQYFGSLEAKVDKMIANMSGLQLSMLKNLLVKKYRSMTK